MRTIHLKLAVLCVAAVACTAHGQLPASLVVPNALATNDSPFGSGTLANASSRSQQVYGTSEFGSVAGEMFITELRFRPDYFYGRAFSATVPNIQVNLSTTARLPDGLSSVFSDNVGADDTVVFSGELTVSSSFTGPASGPKAFDIIVPLSRGFVYNPAAGSLLVDIRNYSGSSASLVAGKGGTDDGASRVIGSLNSGSGTAAGSGVDALQIIYATTTGSNLPPVVLSHPQSRIAVEGTNTSFRVIVSGTPEFSYQWQHSNQLLASGTNSVLNLVNIALADAGSYSVIVSNAFGSVTSQVATLTVTQPPATVRVASVNAAGGGEVIVPVQLRANGNENAVGFSLNFNPALLTFAGVSLGSGAPSGSALLVNTNDTAALGRLGLGVALPADGVFAHGTQEVALVLFTVAPVFNQTTTTISFGDQPTLRQLSDTHAQVLSAVYVSGTAAISDSQVEGDLAPRPDGNRSVAIVDWVQMGRFVALLDPISNSNEFQSADCAPRATKGNGVIGASDWVQVGRFAVGLDPLSIAGGPTEPDAGGGGAFRPASTGTKLSLMNSSIAQGQTNVVPVVLECKGGENAMTFSVTFDPAKLAFVGVAPGPAAVGATMNVNSSLAGTGKIGLALALPPGTSLAPGLREVVQFRFAALVPAPATATVAFGNLPVPSEVSDAQAIPMATAYVPATVTVTPPSGPPLTISPSEDGLFYTITWPVSGSVGFNLEATAGVLGTAWSTVPGVINLGDRKLVIVTPGSGERYFRLKKP